jgi:hypothetical protein
MNLETVRRMFPSFKNSKKQGDAGLGIAIGWLSAQGFDVLLPLTDSRIMTSSTAQTNNSVASKSGPQLKRSVANLSSRSACAAETEAGPEKPSALATCTMTN